MANRRPIATSEQAAWIRARWGSNWEVKRSRPDLLAVGTLKPADFADAYTLELSLSPGRQPSIRVLDPPLICPEGRHAIPHMYDQKTLCLYYPPFGEWTSADRLSDTIIPWASEWLYFYEIWLVTDQWFGGGVHPDGSFD